MNGCFSITIPEFDDMEATKKKAGEKFQLHHKITNMTEFKPVGKPNYNRSHG